MPSPTRSLPGRQEKTKSLKDESPPVPQPTKKSAIAQELDKQRVAQQLAEEARLAVLRQAEEEERKRNQHNLDKASKEDKLKDLLAWIRSIPLSEPCVKRIDRSFSDGALVAEIIHHYCPWMLNKREFMRWYSKSNKRGNWDALNLKVFPKFGFRLSARQINNLLNPYMCGKYQKECTKGIFIYKLLFRIREVLAETNPQLYAYRNASKDKDKEKEDNVNKLLKECKMPKKPGQKNKKPVNMLDHPAFSRVEWLLETGFYDREGATPVQPRRACCCDSDFSFNRDDDFEEKGCGGLSFNFRPNSPPNGMNRCNYDCVSSMCLRPVMSYTNPLMGSVHSCIEF